MTSVVVSGNALERKKDPEKLRAALLAAATAIIADRGLSGLTVDAVARAAGATKGGLFHHFGTKVELIDGVLDQLIERAESEIEARFATDPEPHGRFTRAYLNSVLEQPEDDAVGATMRKLCLAMVADPVLQQRWQAWSRSMLARHAATDENPACAIVRLAADGIWLSSIRAVDPAPPISDAVRQTLLAMTHPSP